jgi:hypothetical protein
MTARNLGVLAEAIWGAGGKGRKCRWRKDLLSARPKSARAHPPGVGEGDRHRLGRRRAAGQQRERRQASTRRRARLGEPRNGAAAWRLGTKPAAVSLRTRM